MMGPVEQDITDTLRAAAESTPGIPDVEIAGGMVEFSELPPLQQNMYLYARLSGIEIAIRRLARVIDEL